MEGEIIYNVLSTHDVCDNFTLDKHPIFKLEDLKTKPCIPCPEIYQNYFHLNRTTNSFYPSGMKNHFIINKSYFTAHKRNDEMEVEEDQKEGKIKKEDESKNKKESGIIKKCLTTLRVKYKTVTVIYFTK
ncbi:MAG: hypothetical protein MJ252_02895 [archaeon]|nr:hypothetical protein [archaeon]